MATTGTRGYVDSYHQSRINHIKGTSYPAALLGVWIGLYVGSMPASDGSGNTDAVRTSVTLGAVTQDPNTGRFYVQPTAAVAFTVPSAGEVVGWGVYGASSGGTPVYFDTTSPIKCSAGQVVTLPASELRVWAEGGM